MKSSPAKNTDGAVLSNELFWDFRFFLVQNLFFFSDSMISWLNGTVAIFLRSRSICDTIVVPEWVRLCVRMRISFPVVSFSPPGALFNQSRNCLIIMPFLSKIHFGKPWKSTASGSVNGNHFPHFYDGDIVLSSLLPVACSYTVCAAFNNMGYAQGLAGYGQKVVMFTLRL